MAQEMVISKELGYLAEFSAGMFDDAAYSTASVPNTISIRQNRFWLVSAEGRVPTPDPLKLHFVTLGVKAPEGRTYYARAYDPESNTPPDCFSYDGVTPDTAGPVVPSRTPGRQADSCLACEMKNFGSATSKLTGAMVPACRTHKDIVVKVMGVEGAWLLRIPPASIKKQWAPLVDRVKKVATTEQAKHGKSTLTMLTCVVEATFDEVTQGVLNFKPLGYLSQSELPAVTTLARDTETVVSMLWGVEGQVRKDKWSNPPALQETQSTWSKPVIEEVRETSGFSSPASQEATKKREVQERVNAGLDANGHIQSGNKPSVKKVEPRITKVEAKPPPAEQKQDTDEVSDILNSMGIFDG